MFSDQLQASLPPRHLRIDPPGDRSPLLYFGSHRLDETGSGFRGFWLFQGAHNAISMFTPRLMPRHLIEGLDFEEQKSLD